MPTVLRKYGIRFHFYGSDMGEPPHIHVTGNGGKAKIWLEPITIASQQGFKEKDMKRIVGVVSEHLAEIMEAWDEFFRSVSGK